jgi:hypothetical protein
MTADQYAELTDLMTRANHVATRLHAEAKQWQELHAGHESEAMAEAGAAVASGLRGSATAAEVYAQAVRAELGKVRLR